MNNLLSDERQEQLLSEAKGYLFEQNQHIRADNEMLFSIDLVAKLGLTPYKDGNQWCVLLGEDIQEGICGFGDSPINAIFDFQQQLFEKQTK